MLKKYTAKNPENSNKWQLATGHYSYAIQIPQTILTFIPAEVREPLTQDVIEAPIGDTAVMHTHNTFPARAQKYHKPMWLIPNQILDDEDKNTVAGSKNDYFATKQNYEAFASDLISRINLL